jgi:hypothetical protein
LSDAYIPEEEIPMLKKLALASTAITLLMSTASADYYIVQEKATKKCKVVETRPTETTWVQVGPAAFKTQSEAECKTSCPLYPQKRTSIAASAMSALCHKRTSHQASEADFGDDPKPTKFIFGAFGYQSSLRRNAIDFTALFCPKPPLTQPTSLAGTKPFADRLCRGLSAPF